MSTIGSLAVNVVANTEKFSKGMKSARKDVTLLGATVNKTKSILTGFAVSLTAGFTVRGLKNTADEMDKIGHAANRLGVTTEALSGLGYAAEISESSVDGLVKGLTFLEKNLGSGKADSSLARLGLDVASLKAMSADQAFLQIAMAMEKLPTAADKTSVAMALFGKSGADLMPFLSEGPAKIAELTAEAAKLGLVFGDSAASGVDAMNDSLTRAMGAVKGLGRELVTSLGPAVESTANGLTDMIVADRRAIFGTEKGPRQDAANKHIANLSDKNFMDFTKANPLGELDEFLANAVRARVDTMTEKANKFGGDPAFSGLFASGMGLMQMFEKDQAERAASQSEWADLGGTDQAHIGGLLSQLGVAGNVVDEPISKALRQSQQVQTNGALEQGTAAAFSQANRSSQAGKMMDISQKTLKQNEAQTKALQSIDKNLKTTQAPMEVVNIA